MFHFCWKIKGRDQKKEEMVLSLKESQTADWNHSLLRSLLALSAPALVQDGGA